ncbi:MAG TPA: hypothetical protein VGT40_22725 [Methylomirabilota bacterium]|jgi:streptogramin lyase|nr:hypothetical protein [Methylomirabilota bacterium]
MIRGVAGFVFLLLAVGSPGTPRASAYSVETHTGVGGQRIVVGADGNFWFTTDAAIGVVDRNGILLNRFPVQVPGPGAPSDLALGPDRNIWYSSLGRIGRITQAGQVTEFDAGPPAVLNATPVALGAITAGPDGAVWFADPGRNAIGRIATDGAITRFPIPSVGPNSFLATSSPSGIVAGPDGNLWFTEADTDRIGRITPAGAITEFPLPTSGAGPAGITVGPDGALWFTESRASTIGRITTTGVITEFALPGFPPKTPAQIVTGADGALWFTLSVPTGAAAFAGAIGRLAADGGVLVFGTPDVVRFASLPADVVLGPDNAIWYIASGLIARVLVDLADVQPAVVAAVLPGSRSVQVGTTATAFATIINYGVAAATGCRITPAASVPADFLYQTTDPQTNALTGTANTPVSILAASQQSFLIAFTPSAAFAPTNVPLDFVCDNAAPAPSQVGLNRLLLSASTSAVQDVIALAGQTPRYVGAPAGALQINTPPGAEFLALAAANVGAAGTIAVSADSGGQPLPLVLTICRSDPATGSCLGPFAASVTLDMTVGATSTFIVFATRTGSIPFDPASNRIFVRFADPNGIVRGATSVAVYTSP